MSTNPFDSSPSTSTSATGHPGMLAAFRPGRMTLGVTTPLEGFPGSMPTLERHAELVEQAEAVGFSTVWVRDVPLVDPRYGDAGQVFDPFTYLGYLAARTNRVALGTASVVLPLRHPIDIAKAAASIDHLSGGRLLLGIATGDRAAEFPAYGIDHETRGEMLQEGLAWLRELWGSSYPHIDLPLGRMSHLDLVPKPASGHLPTFMTGRGRQDIEWIAEHTDGWLFYNLPTEQQALNIRRWRRLTHREDGVFKPFVQASYFDVVEDPYATPVPIHLGLRLGREPLLEHLKQREDIGVDQIFINFKHATRPVGDVMEELGQYVLPHFPAGAVNTDDVTLAS